MFFVLVWWISNLLSFRLKEQITAIEQGKLSRAVCLSPQPCNPDLFGDLVRLINAVRRQRVTTLDLQASFLQFICTVLCKDASIIHMKSFTQKATLICSELLKLRLIAAEQGTPVGCFPRLDVLNAVLELIKDALLWKLDDLVFIGLSNTSLADQHGQQILAFLQALSIYSAQRRPAVQVELNGVLTVHYNSGIFWSM
jgi:hypothetical protein